MNRSFRVIDAGLCEGRYNIALDQAMLELHQEGVIEDSLRFIHFRPIALVGRHQELSTEVDLEYCRRHGIGVGRRITGGGAIYLDSGQLGWTLVFARSTLGGGSLGEVARLICEAAAAGLSQLGVNARFRARNDIEVDGRKIGGTGGFYDADTLIYQGTVLVDLDPATMLGALRIPRAKLAKRGLDSAAQRVVTLRELLGSATPAMETVQDTLLRGFADRLGLRFHPEEVSGAERSRAQQLYESQIGREEFVKEVDGPPSGARVHVGVHTGAGGTITCYLRREGVGGHRIAQVLITGDFFVAPPRLVFDLESHLRGSEIAALGATVEQFFAGRSAEVLSVTPADFCSALRAAVAVAGATPVIG